jgi:hypothetical protein
MPEPSLVGVGVSMFGGKKAADAQSDAASQASAAQLQGTRMSLAETRRQFNTMMRLVGPYVGAGKAATAAEMDLMGLGGQMQKNNAINQLKKSPEFQRLGADQRRAAIAEFKQSDRYRNAGADRREVLDAFKDSDRFKRMGAGARKSAIAALSADPRFNAEARQQKAIGKIEGGAEYGALVDAGENAILQNASATGGLRGGNTERSLAEFRPQILSALIDKQLGRFGGLSQRGQNAAVGAGSSAMQQGQIVSGLFGDRGAAQAGNALAQGQATANQWGGITEGINTALGKLNEDWTF